jgi:hypothetical protein
MQGCKMSELIPRHCHGPYHVTQLFSRLFVQGLLRSYFIVSFAHILNPDELGLLGRHPPLSIIRETEIDNELPRVLTSCHRSPLIPWCVGLDDQHRTDGQETQDCSRDDCRHAANDLS